MADIVSPAKRSQLMAGIRAKDTKPEIEVRRGIFARGFRYRLHVPSLPGKPDLVLPKYRAVIFMHGCFWHRHNCGLFKWPKTHEDFWMEKLTANAERDLAIRAKLLDSGWRVAEIWECALKGKKSLHLSEVLDRLENWIPGTEPRAEIRGW